MEPRRLDIPLEQRSWRSNLPLVAACAACAWMSRQPRQLHDILITLALGTPAFWFGFGPELLPRRYEFHRGIRVVYRVTAVVVLFSVLKWLIPLASRTVGGLS